MVLAVVRGRVGLGGRDAGGRGRVVCGVVGVLCGVLVWLVLGCGVAWGSGSGWWLLGSGLRPSVLSVGGVGEVVVSAEDVGSGVVGEHGGVVRLVDRLPVGLVALRVGGAVPVANTRSGVGCVVVSERVVECEWERVLVPFTQVEVRVEVEVVSGARSGGLNEVVVSGGGPSTAVLSRPVVVGSKGPGFGLQSYSLVSEEVGGGVDLRAGSHPFQLTTAFELNQTADTTPVSKTPDAEPVVLPKDLDFRWPAGLLGNPTTVPVCSDSEFLAVVGAGDEDECPADTAVGVATVTVNEPSSFKATVFTVPVFNLEPEAGEPARFGINVVEAGTPVYIDASVRTGSDYGVTVETRNITQTAGVLSAKVTVWGVPGAAVHDPERGWGCLFKSLGFGSTKPCNVSEGKEPAPFLSLPSQCGVPLESSVVGDSWADPGQYSVLASYTSEGLTGCGGLPFGPELTVGSDTTAGSSPQGLEVGVRVPQEPDENPLGVDSSGIRDVAVSFPEGVSVNPAAASGLEGCSEAQIGYLPGESTPPEVLRFEPGVPSCPAGARVGTVKITTPVLAHPLTGYVYLASSESPVLDGMNENPFGTLLALYLVAQDPVSRTLVKLAGRISLGGGGQVQTFFEGTPDVPFETAQISLFTGERAALSSPALCGTYQATGTFTPWDGGEPVSSHSSFQITSGPAGSGCPGSVLPFKSSLQAGSTNIQAGAYTPFVTRLSHPDGTQPFGRVSVTLPPGVAGVLTGVPLCAEAQANAGTCPAASLIGEASATVGAGDQPYTVTGGKVYLTEHFQGAPFGLSIVTPAVAGPFDLGDVTVRAGVAVNETTGQITVTTSPQGATDPIPWILYGVPLQIKTLEVTVNRAGFTFNPTNCNQLSISTENTGLQNTISTNTVGFRVANCALLKFQPKFTASASSKISRLNGITFQTTLSYPNTGWGTQTNLAKVKVTLPKSLPSRQSTLRKACLASTFETNPADCKPESLIGHATVTTPLLPVPLTGPAYFVSHGGEAFPSLTMLLQGYGITIKLVGNTLISHGITSTTFNTIPDLPFNTFQLTLPANPYSALSGYGNLCKTKPKTTIQYTTQNNQTTSTTQTIKLTDCPKHKTKHTKHKTKTKH